jgi:chromosome segregation ATPase
LPVKSSAESADERASKAEAEVLKALAEVASLKLQLESAEAAVAKAHASCEEKIKKYDADLIYSGQTAGSLRRQLCDAVEEKVRAISIADQSSQREETYKSTIASLQSSKEDAHRRNTALELELTATKQELSNVNQSSKLSMASSMKRIAELDSALSQANATVQRQTALISELQAECGIKEESIASASANITSWAEHCAALQRRIDEVRFSEAAVRESARIEVEAAATQVNIAEGIVQQMQTECCAALKARAEADAQAKSDSIALNKAEAQVRKFDDIVSALRKELEDSASIAASQHTAISFECESLKDQLERAIQSANASASAKDSLKAEVDKHSVQLHHLQQENSAKVTALQKECDSLNTQLESLKGQLERAIQSANASASAKDSLKAEVDKQSAQLHHLQQENSAKVTALQKECESLKTQLEHSLSRENAFFIEKSDSVSLRSAADESKAQITQLNEHLQALREHVSKAAQARVIQDEAYAALSDELDALRNENRDLKATSTSISLEHTTNIALKASIKRLEDDKKTLQGHVDSLIESAQLAVKADKALVKAHAQIEPSLEAARRYKSQADELHIRLDEAVEATASLATQADDLSVENASLKEQVVMLKDQVFFFFEKFVTPSYLVVRSCNCRQARPPRRMRFLTNPASCRYFFELLCRSPQNNMLPQTLEEQLHRIVQQQAQVAQDQTNVLNQALDAKAQELLRVEALLADISQRHHTLQSQYAFPSPDSKPNLYFISCRGALIEIP